MIDFNQIAVPLWRRNSSEKFIPSDPEYKYLENLEKFGSDWHYASKDITYSYNSIGYRSKELSDVTDFFLAYGCSHTEGVGLAEDETWPSIVGKNLNVDYLNHGCGGSGTDMQLVNSMCFLRNSNKLPKFVIIQWPDISRTMFMSDYPAYTGPWVDRLPNIPDNHKNFFKLWITENNDINNGFKNIYTTQLLWKLAKVPVFNFTLTSGYENESSIERFYPGAVDIDTPTKRARDIKHLGPEFNKLLGDWITTKYGTFTSN